MKGAPFQPEIKVIIGRASFGSFRIVAWPAMPTACSAWWRSPTWLSRRKRQP